ncbi:MAG: signal peptidase II [Gemmatimonadota bacterium]|nr:signal peptidase II [Gemmatimonadota bacterium]
MLVRQNSVARFATVAVWTAAVDLITKQIALTELQDHGVRVADGIRLTLAHNNASAFGIWLGPLTWHINFVLTLAAVVLAGMVCRHLAAIDRRAPMMLGLIAGAAIGNLSSMILTPGGVVDFISIGSRSGPRLIFNLADVAAYAGVALSIGTALTISRSIKEQRGRQIPELHIPIPLMVEPVQSGWNTSRSRRSAAVSHARSVGERRESEKNART